MEIRELQQGEELQCFQIAQSPPEWFNEAGLRAIERDLRREKTFVAVEGSDVLGFVTAKSTNRKSPRNPLAGR